jgi:hypothetical protein
MIERVWVHFLDVRRQFARERRTGGNQHNAEQKLRPIFEAHEPDNVAPEITGVANQKRRASTTAKPFQVGALPATTWPSTHTVEILARVAP